MSLKPELSGNPSGVIAYWSLRTGLTNLRVTQERGDILNEKRKDGESATYQVSHDKLTPKCPYLLLSQKKGSTRGKATDTVSLALVDF